MIVFLLKETGILPSETSHPFDSALHPARSASMHHDWLQAPVTNHGGVAVIISDRLKCKLVSLSFRPKTFESVCFSVTGSTSTVMVLLIERPGSVPPNELFFKKLTSYLEVLVLYKCQGIVACDFNIHMKRSTSADAVKPQNIIDSFDYALHVPLTPTHIDGGTQDLV